MLKRMLLLVLLAFLSGMAMAGWEQVGADGRTYLFADRQTILKADRRVKMWHLVDFKERYPENGMSYQSSRVEVEYDCYENRFRELSATFHPFRLGDGPASHAMGGARDWQAIPNGSGIELLSNIACEREKSVKSAKKKK